MSLKNQIKQHIWVLASVLTFPIPSYAGTEFNCDSVQSGDWDDPTTWVNCNGSFPDSSEDLVVIKDGHTVTFNIDAVTVNRFSMEVNSILDVATSANIKTMEMILGDFDTTLGTIILAADLTINGNNEAVKFGILDGNHHLVINSSNITRFSRAIGNIAPLKSITTDAPGNTNLTQTYSIELNGGTDTTFNDNMTIGASGSVTFNHSGLGDLVFNGSITNSSGSPHRLYANTDNSGIIFNENVSIGRLETGGQGTTWVNANMQTNSGGADDGDMIFNNPVIVTKDTTFTTTGAISNIIFNNTLNIDDGVFSTWDIILNSPNEITLNQVGNNNPPLEFSSIGSGNIVVNGDINTWNEQLYIGSVIQTTDIVFFSHFDLATFGGGLDGAGNNTQFIYGADLNLDAVTINNINTLTLGPSSGKINLSADFNSPVNQIYHNPVELFNTVILTADLIQMNGNITSNLNGLEINTSSDQSLITGNIDFTGGQLWKSGSGVLTLTGSVDVDGTTHVQEGALFSNFLHSNDVSVNNGAIFGGTASISAPITVSDSATVTPGPALSTSGNLSVTDFTLSSNATFDVDINGTTPATEYDQLITSGVIDLQGHLILNGNHSVSTGESFTILQNDSPNPITGTFSGFVEGSMVNNSLQVSYVGGDGNDVVLTGLCDQTSTVTNNADSGPGSLRQAITDVCDQGMVNFDDTYSITFLSHIDINKQIQILGNGQTFDGGNATGLFQVTDDLFIMNVNLINANSAFGAIRNTGNLNLFQTYFANNTASGSTAGGAITNNSTGFLSVIKTSFFQNNAARGGAIFTESLNDSYITNSTFYQNGQDSNFEGGAVHNRGRLNIRNTSIVESGDGTSANGNSLFNWGSNTNLVIENTLIFSSSPTTECTNTGGAVITGSSFLIDDGSCGAPLSGDPLLDSWANYGAFANSIPLLSGSPMINTGDDAFCPPDDQIDTPRPQGIHCDIGAMEFIDTVAPSVTQIMVNGDVLSTCDSRADEVIELQVTFSERVLNAENSNSYDLIHAGDDQRFDIGPPLRGGDDYYPVIDAVVSDNDNATPTITLSLYEPIKNGILLLNVNSAITDEFFNDLDNGSDYEHQFRIDLGNLVNNGHFDDCSGSLDFTPWLVAPGDYSSVAAADADNSNVSDSLSKTSGDSPWAIAQCVDMNADLPLFMGADMKEFIDDNTVFPSVVELSCQQYDQQTCMGNSLENLTYTIPDFHTDNQWTAVKHKLGHLNPATQSAECRITMTPIDFINFVFFIDKIRVTLEDLIFADDFETDQFICQVDDTEGC